MSCLDKMLLWKDRLTTVTPHGVAHVERPTKTKCLGVLLPSLGLDINAVPNCQNEFVMIDFVQMVFEILCLNRQC